MLHVTRYAPSPTTGEFEPLPVDTRDDATVDDEREFDWESYHNEDPELATQAAERSYERYVF